MIHLNRITIHPDNFPDTQAYPYHLAWLKQVREISFKKTITFFIGENGSGKSTLLNAIAHRCNIHIWQNDFNLRVEQNPHERDLYKSLTASWANGPVKGSFFSSQIFTHFAQNLEEWAINDIKMLDFFGGKSLITQSHGQSLMSYFKSRYDRKGIYFLDEPETALSPHSLVDLVNLLNSYNHSGEAQFIIATHSPILLACPKAQIYTFNQDVIDSVSYTDTPYYQVYKAFLNNPESFID